MFRKSKCRSSRGARRIAQVQLLILCLAVFTACSREREEIALPETPVLGVQDRYALVTDHYARMYVTPQRNADITGVVRKGDILSVAGRMSDDDWIEVRRIPSGGWIEGSRVRLFPSREMALNALGMMGGDDD